ncbi:hypothetical protein ABNIH25_16394, partial [Acinetobacter baumannii ABNIH25]
GVHKHSSCILHQLFNSMKAAINELMGTIHLFSKITIFMCIYIDQFDNFKLCNFSFCGMKNVRICLKKIQK